MNRSHTPETQLFYGRVIAWGAKLGFGLLLLTFLVYIFGLLPPYVSFDSLPHYWSFSDDYYREMARIQPGWSWLQMLQYGDFLTYLPMAMLAAVTIIGYLAVVGKFFRRGETILGIMIIIQIALLTVAASGILRIGGH